MRIGFFTPEYVTEAYFSGGLANATFRTATALAARGHDVHVFTLTEVKDEDFVADRVTVHRITLGSAGRLLQKLTRNRLKGSAAWIDLMIRMYLRARRVHRQTPFDVFQVPNYSGCGLLTTLLLRVPFVLRLSTYGPEWNDRLGWEKGADRAFDEWIERLQVRIARYIYAPSECVRQLAQTKGGMHRVAVVRTTFALEPVVRDASVFNDHFAGKRYLLYFGRFQLHKGFHIVVDALPRILEENPDCVAALVGSDSDAPLAPSMLDYARRVCAGFGDRLIILGQLPHAQLYPVVAEARLVVLPSLIDNLPNVCLEAMALGRAVVGTQGTSFEELLVEGRTGFLVPPGDADALASKVSILWKCGTLDEIGKAACESVLRFHPDITLPVLEEFFQSAINEH